jgi:hypothetical protein
MPVREVFWAAWSEAPLRPGRARCAVLCFGSRSITLTAAAATMRYLGWTSIGGGIDCRQTLLGRLLRQIPLAIVHLRSNRKILSVATLNIFPASAAALSSRARRTAGDSVPARLECPGDMRRAETWR